MSTLPEISDELIREILLPIFPAVSLSMVDVVMSYRMLGAPPDGELFYCVVFSQQRASSWVAGFLHGDIDQISQAILTSYLLWSFSTNEMGLLEDLDHPHTSIVIAPYQCGWWTCYKRTPGVAVSRSSRESPAVNSDFRYQLHHEPDLPPPMATPVTCSPARAFGAPAPPHPAPRRPARLLSRPWACSVTAKTTGGKGGRRGEIEQRKRRCRGAAWARSLGLCRLGWVGEWEPRRFACRARRPIHPDLHLHGPPKPQPPCGILCRRRFGWRLNGMNAVVPLPTRKLHPDACPSVINHPNLQDRGPPLSVLSPLRFFYEKTPHPPGAGNAPAIAAVSSSRDSGGAVPDPNPNRIPGIPPADPPAGVNSDVVVILAALLCALICVVGLAAVARCARSRRNRGAGADGGGGGPSSPSSNPGDAAGHFGGGGGHHGTGASTATTTTTTTKGLKKKALKALPKLAYADAVAAAAAARGAAPAAEGEKAEELLAECAICLAEFGEREEVRVMPQCGHGFHVACVDTWLRSNSSCPSCRRPIVLDDPAPPKRCRKCEAVVLEAVLASSSSSSSAAAAGGSGSGSAGRGRGGGGGFLPPDPVVELPQSARGPHCQ
nr:unnamed protein product [Digitaria exilis]